MNISQNCPGLVHPGTLFDASDHFGFASIFADNGRRAQKRSASMLSRLTVDSTNLLNYLSMTQKYSNMGTTGPHE